MADQADDLAAQKRKLDEDIGAHQAMLQGQLPVAIRATLEAALKGLHQQHNEINAQSISATNAVAGNQLNNPVFNINIHEPGKPAPTDDPETKYLKGLRKRLTRLPLGDSDDDAQGVTLESVYIALDTRTQLELTDDEKAAYKQQNPNDSNVPDTRTLSALEAMGIYNKVVLLGDPGSGKSSFVNQLAARLALARLCEKEKKPFDALPYGLRSEWLPVVMTLRDLAPRLADIPSNLNVVKEHEALVAAIWDQWRADLARDIAGGLAGGLAEGLAEDFADELEAALDQGRVLLCFDGLDEVPEATRVRVRKAVLALLHDYRKVIHILITCRTRSYQDELFPKQFVRQEVALFDEDKITAFVRQWYAARLPPDEAAPKAEELARAALEPSLRELAQNPMLLTTMALLHQRQLGLPKERAKLYNDAVGVLMERWQKKGIAVPPKLEQTLKDNRKLREMLRTIAHAAHTAQSQNSEADLSRGELLTLLEQNQFLGAQDNLPSDFLDYIDQRAGLLIGLGGDGSAAKPKTYKFPHRTFQEYLTGCYLVAGRDREILARYEACAKAGDYWALAALLGAEELLHVKDDPEAVLDLAYKLCPLTRPPQNTAEWRALLWSGQCAVLLTKERVLRDRSADGGRAYLDRLLPRLVTLLTDPTPLLPAQERAEAGRVLARLGDPRREVLDVDAIFDTLCPIPAGEFWMGSDESDPESYENERPLHRQRIAQPYAIARFPVTQAQYQTFVADGGYLQAQWWRQAGQYWQLGAGFKGQYDDAPRTQPNQYTDERFLLPNHPVVGVSWHEAVAFCQWLTARWRKAGVLTAKQVVRLPSEAEWERAARGDQDQRSRPWGDGLTTEQANYSDTNLGSTSAVGTFAAGRAACGAEELIGNVDEWTSTKWEGED